MTKQGTDGVSRSPLHLLHRVSQCAEAIFQSRTTGGLTPRQLAVLQVVADHEGLSQTGLVERTGIDRSTTADIVRRLVRRGWLQRRRSKKDARAYVLKLTEACTTMLTGAEPFARGVDTRVLNSLPKGRREAFMAFLANRGRRSGNGGVAEHRRSGWGAVTLATSDVS
jgi:DNA-binding MarR family transcriptional regulator